MGLQKLQSSPVFQNNAQITVLVNNPIRISTINFFLQDNTSRSSLFMTLGWIRYIAGKNNFINQ